MSDNKHHNQGQKDGQTGKQNPPNDFLRTSIIGDSAREENNSYYEGYYKSSGQSGFNENNYQPPSDPKDKEDYDKGWNAAKNS